MDMGGGGPPPLREESMPMELVVVGVELLGGCKWA